MGKRSRSAQARRRAQRQDSPIALVYLRDGDSCVAEIQVEGVVDRAEDSYDNGVTVWRTVGDTWVEVLPLAMDAFLEVATQRRSLASLTVADDQVHAELEEAAREIGWDRAGVDPQFDESVRDEIERGTFRLT